MIKKNKITLIFASVLTLLPVIAGVILWDKLPQKLPIHWNFAGETDSYGGKAFFVFGMPLIMLALLWICAVITSFDKSNKNQNAKVIRMVLWIVPVLSCVLDGATYIAVLNDGKISLSLVNIIIGLMFIIMGNYLPKCKHNKTIGIKIKWTLENEENWQATHRVGGMVWFFTGIALLVSALLPQTAAGAVMIAAIVIAVLVPTVYSYVYYKKTK